MDADSLQTLNSKLENENRMLRAQLDAAKKILKYVLIDNPIVMDISTFFGMSPGQAIRDNKDMFSLYQRIELLEKDAWTATSLETRAFVIETKALLEDPGFLLLEGSHEWLLQWTERLQKALG